MSQTLYDPCEETKIHAVAIRVTYHGIYAA
jgi:hypothetical protein